MKEVTLQQVLQAREDRVNLQKQFLQKYRCPLIVFTMNIAGPVKTNPLIERGFYAGLQMLQDVLPAAAIQEIYIHKVSTGWEGYLPVDLPAKVLKNHCIKIEEATSLGRLLDMDVLDADGRKLERDSLRGCLVCGKPGRVCAAGRLHSVEQLQAATGKILRDHFVEVDRERIARLACECLLDEANTTPKPGLVDRRNCGSHTDMCLQTFISSANALRSYFAACVTIGHQTAHLSPKDTFLRLRQAGIQAEKTMLEATGGVNTHKGAIFTLGILCGCIGRLGFWELKELLHQASLMGKEAEGDFTSATGHTAGERLYLQENLRGIRGEVADGLLCVVNIGLPVYQEALVSGLSPNDAGVVTLLHLIANVQDTNLYHRGGAAGAAWAAESAKNLLQTAAYPPTPFVEKLDDAFITRNLSPGGCADLLAVTYFLHRLNS